MNIFLFIYLLFLNFNKDLMKFTFIINKVYKFSIINKYSEYLSEIKFENHQKLSEIKIF